MRSFFNTFITDKNLERSIKFNLNSDDIIFTKADKGNMLVTIKKNDYIKNTNEFIMTGNIKIITKVPEVKFLNEGITIVRNSVDLIEEMRKYKST